MVGRWQKNLKKHWLKPPKAVTWKTKLGSKYKWFKNLIFGILFLKILFWAYKVFIFVQTFHWMSSDFFFNFRFSSRKSQSQQKLAKKITHFTIEFCSKSLTHVTHLSSLDIENNMLSQHSRKPFWLYKFSASLFLFGVRKNICTPPFLDAIHCCLLHLLPPLPKWRTCWMAPIKTHNIATYGISCNEIMSERSKIWKSLAI